MWLRPWMRWEGLLSRGRPAVMDSQHNGDLGLALSHLRGLRPLKVRWRSPGCVARQADPRALCGVGLAQLSGRIFLLTRFLLAFDKWEYLYHFPE